LDATVKKAVWNSHKLHRFPKANLIIYSEASEWGPIRGQERCGRSPPLSVAE
jgi:hypothetical protein